MTTGLTRRALLSAAVLFAGPAMAQTGSAVVFQATVTFNAGVVPEPTSAALFISALGALGAFRWRRPSNAA